jgi:hypothetical protein
MCMSDESEVSPADEVAALLSEAAEIHAMVYRITEDEDPDWSSWYAKWLLDLSELPELMAEDISSSQLTYELVRLDREYTEFDREEPWEMFYAERLLEVFGTVDLDESDEDDDDEEEEDDDDFESSEDAEDDVDNFA